jgi:hypothetical protein
VGSSLVNAPLLRKFGFDTDPENIVNRFATKNDDISFSKMYSVNA